MDRPIAFLLCFFVVAAIFAGLLDAGPISTSDRDTLNSVLQTDVTVTNLSNAGANPISWLTAVPRFVAKWFQILTLGGDVRVFFQGWGSYVLAIILIIAAIAGLGLIIRLVRG